MVCPQVTKKKTDFEPQNALFWATDVLHFYCPKYVKNLTTIGAWLEVLFCIKTMYNIDLRIK